MKKNIKFTGFSGWTFYSLTAVVLAAIAACGFAIAACGPPSGQAQENSQQQQDTKTLVNNQPIPHFKFSEERAILIEAEIAAANGTASTSFVWNFGVPHPIFECPSLGLGVPDTAQLSDPQQVVNAGGSGNPGIAIGQMDPFGIYSPPSSAGTYLVCVAPDGHPYLSRFESDVDTILGTAVWNARTGMMQQLGVPPPLNLHQR